MQTYKSFLVTIKSNYGKKIAYFLPTQFKEIEDTEKTEKQLCFYWITNENQEHQMITTTNSQNNIFLSNKKIR